MTPPVLNPAAILNVLNRHGVEYVVIGGFAAQLYDAPIDPTSDIDLTPARTYENSRRLDAALTELKAKIRLDAAPYALAFGHSPESVSQIDMLNLTCEFGDFDISYVPSGTTGYDDLARAAHTILIGDLSAQVADLADIIRSKRAAGRPKDIAVLPALYEHAKTLNLDASYGVRLSHSTEPEMGEHERPESPQLRRRRR